MSENTRKNLYSYIALIIIFFGIFFLTTLKKNKSNIQEVGVYDCLELEFTTNNIYSNAEKYSIVTINATFHGPNDSSYTVPGFWDGSNTWKIRFAPTIPGEWSYSISSSDSQLDSVSNDGSFKSYPLSTEKIIENPNYRGFIKVSDNRRYFVYADGTPFFWMGGTIWDGNSKIMPFDTDFKIYVDDRKNNNFTVIQILIGEPEKTDPTPRHTGYNEGGAIFNNKFNEINPNNFHFFDKRINYIINKGIVPIIFFNWGNLYNKMTIQELKNYYGYIIARYQAYNVIWCLSGEYSGGNNITRINLLGNYVDNIDVLDHLITIHPGGLEKGFPSTTHDFLKQEWIDFHMEQTWHLNEHTIMIDDYNKNDGPVVNAEAGYDELWGHDGNRVRKEAWTVFMSGGAGYTYGINGIWAWNNGSYDNLGSIEVKRWYDVINSSSRTYMKHIVNYFSEIEWWKMEPKYEFTNVGYCLSENGKQYLIYLPDGGNVTVDFSNVSGIFMTYLFNPRTGETKNVGVISGNNQVFLMTPDQDDWIIYIIITE